MKQAPRLEGRAIGWLERLGTRLRNVPGSPGLRRSLRKLFHALLYIRTGGRGMICSLPQNETVRVLPEFRYIAWNLDEYTAFRQTVHSGMTVLDIGANVGAYSLLLGQWVRPNGHVYSFEPAPASFDALQRHIQLNHLEDSVTAFSSAVSARTGPATIFPSGASGANRLATAIEERARGGLSVTCTTLDDFCATRGLTPQFVKIDVEGFELEVLRGARKTIARCRGQLAIFVELHPATWELIGVQPGELLAELAAQRLRLETLSSANDPWTVEGVCVRLAPD